MMEKKQLAKIGLVYTVATLFNKGFAFLTVPIFSRILSQNDYGIVNTFTSWQNIFAILIGMSLYMGLRTAFIDYEKNVNEVLSTIVTFTMAMGLFVLGISLAIVQIFGVGIDSILVICCCLQAFYSAVLSDFLVFLEMNYRYRLKALLMILPEIVAAITSIISILFICKNKYYMGRIGATTVVYIIFSVFMLFLIQKQHRLTINMHYLKICMKVSVPLLFHALSLYILNQSDRVMITGFRNASETAIYSLVYNFSMIAMVITNSLNGIYTPWFIEKLKKNDIVAINKVSKDYSLLMTIALVGVVLISPEILKIMAPKSYWDGIAIIPLVVFANYFIFLYSFYVNIEHYYRKTFYTSINTMVAAVCNIILNIIFIPKWGYVAAAGTTFVSYLISLIMHALYSGRIRKDIYPIKCFKWHFLQIICAGVIFVVFMNNWILRWGIAIVYAIIIVIVERKKIGNYIPALSRFGFFGE